jgi:hypothetical protein
MDNYKEIIVKIMTLEVATSAITIKRGNKQGYSQSLILFDLFINSWIENPHSEE